VSWATSTGSVSVSVAEVITTIENPDRATTELVGASEGCNVGLMGADEGWLVGASVVGACVVGALVGSILTVGAGDMVGAAEEGDAEGTPVGASVVGPLVGTKVGVTVLGEDVGALLDGAGDGTCDGASEAVTEGVVDGEAESEGAGLEVGGSVNLSRAKKR
jgi:hypothetical protein